MLKADSYVKYLFSIKGWFYLKFMALLMEAKTIVQRRTNVKITIGSIIL